MPSARCLSAQGCKSSKGAAQPTGTHEHPYACCSECKCAVQKSAHLAVSACLLTCPHTQLLADLCASFVTLEMVQNRHAHCLCTCLPPTMLRNWLRGCVILIITIIVMVQAPAVLIAHALSIVCRHDGGRNNFVLCCSSLYNRHEACACLCCRLRMLAEDARWHGARKGCTDAAKSSHKPTTAVVLAVLTACPPAANIKGTLACPPGVGAALLAQSTWCCHHMAWPARNRA